MEDIEMASGIDLEAAGKAAIEILRCSACTEYLIEPVFACDEWHPMCGYCFFRLDKRTCGCSLSLKESNCAKRLLRLIFPSMNCRNQLRGCTEKCTPALMWAHLEVCIFRNVACPIQGENCNKRACSPQEAFPHLKMDHDIKELNCILDMPNNCLSVCHKTRIYFNCVNTGIFEPPVFFTSIQNFLISYEIFNGVFVWWVCTDDVVDICKEFEYETSIALNETGCTTSMVTGKGLPVYGIRYLTLSKLLQINGSFSTCSVNTLFVKKFEHRNFGSVDFVEIMITVKLTSPSSL